ncbi:PLDc N-terminal domain-containing protein [Streptomyces sp. NPDC048518]|uniref:PLDc N-terminal domain-containing protein n=1 Tax=Streptomyces sp. NPDC048518 TaxID=3155029 RepID=UPI0033C6BA1A
MLRYLPFLLVLAVWIYAFIDVLNTPEKEVRHLPKVVWVIIVLLFGEVLLGPVAWLVTGKVRQGPGAGGGIGGRGRGGSTRWVAPDDNPEFLKSLRDEDPDDDRRDRRDKGEG